MLRRQETLLKRKNHRKEMHGNSKMKKTTDEKKPSYKKETGGQKIFKYDIDNPRKSFTS